MATRDVERVAANMAAAGDRINDARRIVLAYARHQLRDVIAASDLGEADDIRRDRALAEYGDFASRHLTPEHVRAAADAAERIVNAVANSLASPRPLGPK